MKRILAIAVAVCLGLLATPVMGADTATITITVTPSGTLSISVTPTTYDFGSLAYGASANTTTDYFNITNDGTIGCKVQINGSDTTSWTIASSTGYNQFKMTATTDGLWGNADDVVLSTTLQDLVSSLTPSSYQTFGLKLEMPTGGSTTTQQTITVTLKAVSL